MRFSISCLWSFEDYNIFDFYTNVLYFFEFRKAIWIFVRLYDVNLNINLKFLIIGRRTVLSSIRIRLWELFLSNHANEPTLVLFMLVIFKSVHLFHVKFFDTSLIYFGFQPCVVFLVFMNLHFLYLMYFSGY